MGSFTRSLRTSEGPLDEPPAEFLSHVCRVLTSVRATGLEINESTQHNASRDMWCESGPVYAWARRHGGGGVVELSATLLNRTGPIRRSVLHSIHEVDLPWGVHWDTFRDSAGRRRVWGEGRPAGEIITGNPPYDAESIRRFCSQAACAKNPVMGILPARCRADGSDLDCVETVEHSGGCILAHFVKSSRAFVPLGFWFGEDTAGLNRGLPAEAVLVMWHAPALPRVAHQELRELIALSLPTAQWKLFSWDAEFWGDLQGPPPMVTTDPLKEARAMATASTRPSEAAVLSQEADEDAESSAPQLRGPSSSHTGWPAFCGHGADGRPVGAPPLVARTGPWSGAGLRDRRSGVAASHWLGQHPRGGALHLEPGGPDGRWAPHVHRGSQPCGARGGGVQRYAGPPCPLAISGSAATSGAVAAHRCLFRAPGRSASLGLPP